MNESEKFNQIPANACMLTVGEFELGDNGENAKSAPVKLVARSGKAIEHWFWGKVVHDLSGMHMHKPRLPIDYVHDSKEVIGYLNRFDITSGDLVTAGALVPFKESDRATEIIHKSREGVPYEASINFGGDGIKVEEVPEGFITEVNGAKFEGPGVIIREWPLRGVAICPYGADANTESSLLAGNNAKMFTASVISTVPKVAKKETEMSEKQESVEVAATAVEEPKAEELENQETVEETPVEAKEDEAKEAVEADAVEADEKSEVEEKVEEIKPEMSRDEFLKIVEEFGNDIAIQIVRDGGDYQKAIKLAYDATMKKNMELSEKLKEMEMSKTGTPIKVVDAPKNDKPTSLFKIGK